MTTRVTGNLAAYGVMLAVQLAVAVRVLHARGATVRLSGRSHVLIVVGSLPGVLLDSAASAGVLMHALLSSCVVTAAITDLASGYVLDVTTYGAIVASLALAVVDGDVMRSLAGIACGTGPMLLLFALTRGRGLGLGDVKLAAAMGACLGSVPVLAAIGAAFVLGAAIGVCLLASRRQRLGDALAFAPYLATGTLLSMLVVPAHG